MNIEDDFDDQYDDEDDAVDGRRTLTDPFDSKREKQLREWVDRFAEICNQLDDYGDDDNNNPDPTDVAIRQWKATHVLEEVELPCLTFRGTETCEVYLVPKPGCVFTTTDKAFERFARYSNFVLRQLQRTEGAHRGYTLDEIEDDGEDRYLLDGVIPAGELTVIYGAPKHGKSAWAQKLSVCVITDNLDFDGLPVEHGRVLFVTLDPGARRKQVKRRIREICNRLGAPDVLGNKKLVIVDDVVCLDDKESVDHFLQRNPGKFALIVIDPLYKAMTSGDPSIAGAMVAATEGMKTIIGATGGALLIVHHATKSNGEMYGSVFLKAALDAQLFVERAKDTVTVTVEVVKNGEPPDKPFVYRLEKEYLSAEPPVDHDDPPGYPNEPANVTRPDMLELIPTERTLIAKVRPLIDHLLRAPTRKSKEKEWARVRAAWVRDKLVIHSKRDRTIQRVTQ
jgi:hypothetical protein